jgi:hypothetical protein
MPCQVNSILKLKPSQGYPKQLTLLLQYQVFKDGYRIMPLDIFIPLDVVINQVIWEKNQTSIFFEIKIVYDSQFSWK